MRQGKLDGLLDKYPPLKREGAGDATLDEAASPGAGRMPSLRVLLKRPSMSRKSIMYTYDLNPEGEAIGARFGVEGQVRSMIEGALYASLTCLGFDLQDDAVAASIFKDIRNIRGRGQVQDPGEEIEVISSFFFKDDLLFHLYFGDDGTEATFYIKYTDRLTEKISNAGRWNDCETAKAKGAL
jgi:hypothetical protein